MKRPLKWEFSGGKIENSESKAKCLGRKILEELAIIFTVEKELRMVKHY